MCSASWRTCDKNLSHAHFSSSLAVELTSLTLDATLTCLRLPSPFRHSQVCDWLLSQPELVVKLEGVHGEASGATLLACFSAQQKVRSLAPQYHIWYPDSLPCPYSGVLSPTSPPSPSRRRLRRRTRRTPPLRSYSRRREATRRVLLLTSDARWCYLSAPR